ncbi:MAG TPA: hypothetical protein VF384_13945, partial [Planctomycetota bacterium]
MAHRQKLRRLARLAECQERIGDTLIGITKNPILEPSALRSLVDNWHDGRVANLKLRKISPVRLRDAGFDEAWLQAQIAKDTSLLGLGDLHLIQREKIQPTGGRIDFLMSDPESETRFEVEVMLGTVDESHIIRTIEYWDVERQRYPTLEHRAVIVAEEITARFFNVIRLLNRAVPLVAIQLSAFVLDDSIVLHFTRVLDTYEFGAEPEEEGAGEQADRTYWEKRVPRESLEIVDAVLTLVPTKRGEPRVTYNRGHIAVGTTGYNFLWLFPKRSGPYCHVQLKVPSEKRP